MGKTRSLFAAAIVLLPACATILGIGDVPPPSSGALVPSPDGAVVAVCDSTTDTSGDGHHCGRCGHDCLGGACRNGACQPAVIVTAALVDAQRVFAGSLEVDSAQHLVWTDGLKNGDGEYSSSRFTVRTCTLPGCKDTTSVIEVDGGVDYGVAGERAYFLPYGQENLYGCTLPDCTSRMPLLSGLAPDEQVFLDSVDPASSSLLFEVEGPSPRPVQLRYCSLPGCAQPKVIDSDISNYIFAMTDGTNVYFRGVGSGVTRCPIDGCGLDGGTSIDETMSKPFAFANGRLLGRSGSRIVSCALPECSDQRPVVENVGTGPLGDLVTDDTFVYWLTQSNVLVRCPLTGCEAPETVFTGTPPADCNLCASQRLTRDAKSLVWENWDKIYRLALP